MFIEFRYRFEAAHRFLESESKACMTPHGHSWHATMALSFTGTQLNSSQMTVEFSSLKKQWKTLIQETFDHSYMHNINDPVVEVLNSGPVKARLIPFPGDPTTELIALFMFSKMDQVLNHSPVKDRVQVSSIIIEETPTNKIICSRDFYKNQMEHFKAYDGWWTSIDTEDRSLRVR